MASVLPNSSGGGLGRGASVKVLRAVGLNGGDVLGLLRTDHSRYLGFFNDGSSSSSSWLSALLSFVSSFPAVVTHMSSPAVLFLLLTLPFVPLVARFILFPVLPMLRPLSSISL